MSKKVSKNIPVKKIPVKKESTKSKSYGSFIPLILLTVITLICFSNAFKNDFTNWDDHAYVVENNLIRSLSVDNIKEIFSSFVMGNYHPIAVLSLAIDYNFFQLDPEGYHATSIFIHVLNVLLVFVFIRLLTGSSIASFIIALLFGIHPMHVESVSWISERKDVLYLFFYMATLCMYMLFIRREKRKASHYLLTILFFSLSLLSKGQAVTLPVILLLIDFFKGRKFDRKNILEKIPFFLMSVGIGIVAVIAQKDSGAILDIPTFPLGIRILFASYSFLLYILKSILPYGLSTFYPYPTLTTDYYPVIYYVAPALALLLLGILIKYFRKNKTIIFGSGFFIINIFLLLQLLPVGGSIMSERYTYLCYVGLFFIAGNGFATIWEGKNKYEKYKILFAVIMVVYSIFLGYSTFQRNKVWKNSDTLWTNVINQFPRAVIAYGNRGSYYQKQGDLDKAMEDFNAALSLKPDHPETLINRSDVYRLRGQIDSSIADCNKALQANNTFKGAYMNRGIAYCMAGRLDEALKDFNQVIEIEPENSNVYCNRGNLYDMRGLLDSAVSDYTKAISLKPDYYEALYNRGKTQMRKMNHGNAIADFSEAIKYNPKYTEAFFYRSISYKALGNFDAALQDASAAQQLGKQIDQAYINELKQSLKGN